MSTTSADNRAWAIAENLALFCWVVTRTAVVDLVAGKTARRLPHLHERVILIVYGRQGPVWHFAWHG